MGLATQQPAAQEYARIVAPTVEKRRKPGLLAQPFECIDDPKSLFKSVNPLPFPFQLLKALPNRTKFFRMDHSLLQLSPYACPCVSRNKECRKCAKTLELPSMDLDFDDDETKGHVVERMSSLWVDEEQFRNLYEPTLHDQQFFKVFEADSFLEMASALLVSKKGCIEEASTSDAVANLNFSLEEVLENRWRCLTKRKPTDCTCEQHEFRNAYAKVVCIYVDSLARIPDLQRLGSKDRMKQIQFCFTRFICLHLTWNGWARWKQGREMETGWERKEIFFPFSRLTDQMTYKNVIEMVKKMDMKEEEFAFISQIIMFSTGANLSPEGQAALRQARHFPHTQLAEFLQESRFGQGNFDVMERIQQQMEWMVLIGDLAESVNQQLVMAAAFDWAYLRGNLTFDLHLREY